jgi:SAM-dependent methyltransferase
MSGKQETYGGLDHYKDERGAAYYQYQRQGGLQRGTINARKFEAHIASSDTVLDFGCGGGSLLASLNCQRRIGVEINPAARQEASALNIEVYETLAQVDDGTVHKIISNHALEHVPYPLQALRECRTKLVPGGTLILCVPIDDWRMQRAVNVQDINRHLYTWTPLLLGNLLDEAGYKIESVKVYTHAWPPHWERLDRLLPVSLFDAVCTLYSALKHRRQLIAVARNA